jgi:hypothetical protein
VRLNPADGSGVNAIAFSAVGQQLSAALCRIAGQLAAVTIFGEQSSDPAPNSDGVRLLNSNCVRSHLLLKIAMTQS